MKALVAYYSETGNTEKIARAIYDKVSKMHEAHLKRVEDVTADILNDYDLVFLGSCLSFNRSSRSRQENPRYSSQVT